MKMLNCSRPATKKKYVLPSTASHKTRSPRINFIGDQTSISDVRWNFFAGSAAATRLIPKLQAKPTIVKPRSNAPE